MARGRGRGRGRWGPWGPKPPTKPCPTTNTTLYGLFQLSDRLACSSNTTTPSLNICGLSCTSLIDDDISDDISCVLQILTNFLNQVLGDPLHLYPLKRAMKGFFQDECRSVNATSYFAECSESE